ncbi:sulfatase family protein [Larkinella terrae]|uniref:Sulfatase-like hydrolase/transferase n=1 Tax=Larkinella terrae TaxID=2025311 RepID=A0A7K0EPV6_9BACT|nr:sulfatase [Larkinella terrae]MRS63827.1 sulfatase-like hydrolase/transferase [Larkinella terrae]
MTLFRTRTFSEIIFSIAFFVGIGFALSGWISKPAASPPNVVLFFIDDMGYGDLSCNGASGYTTANLDRMAAEGTRFTSFLAAQAVCSASRAALLTGCYPNRLGISGAFGPNSPIGLNPDEETIAELLKEKGYATGIFGKWHLGSQKAFLPQQQGFDDYFGVPYSHDMWPLHPNQAKANYPPLYLIEGNMPTKEVKTLDDASQLTPAITERAVGFIRKHKKEPFFLYVPHPLPHVPLAASSRFRGKSGAGLLGDVMLELDWSVGQILQELKQQGLDKNTIVIFTSDNGPWLNYGNHAGSAGGFREGKGTSFEGGHRVPCIIRWPGVVPAGRVCNKLLTTMDILPTLSKLTGARLPKKSIDGVDMLALLKGDDTLNPRDHFYYYYRQNSLEAVRKGDWKLVFAHPGRTYEGFAPGVDGKPGPTTESHDFTQALYDLRRDPGERYDVREQNPEIVAVLEKLAEDARADLGDDLQKRTGKNVRPAGRIEK